jgi:hypothetical protein
MMSILSRRPCRWWQFFLITGPEYRFQRVCWSDHRSPGRWLIIYCIFSPADWLLRRSRGQNDDPHVVAEVSMTNVTFSPTVSSSVCRGHSKTSFF